MSRKPDEGYNPATFLVYNLNPKPDTPLTSFLGHGQGVISELGVSKLGRSGNLVSLLLARAVVSQL